MTIPSPAEARTDVTRPPATWSRAERVALATRLHPYLGTAEVARRLHVSGSTVRDYLSDPTGAGAQERRRRAAGGRCERCGQATGAARGERRFTLCPRCAPADRAVWSSARVLSAYRRWSELFGQPPTSTDWNRSHATRRGGDSLRRFLTGSWPTATVVARHFGGWPQLRAAYAELARTPHQRLAETP